MSTTSNPSASTPGHYKNSVVHSHSALPAVQISSATIAGVQSTRITYHGRVICLTQQLAQIYACTDRNITDNYQRNTDHFEEGKHFIKLEGRALQEFRDLCPANSGVQISPMVRSLFLWTERGAARHAKMLTTDRAWDMFEQMEEAYFRQAGQPSAPVIDSHEGALLALQQLTAQQLALIQENKRTAAELALAAPKAEFVDRYVQPGTGSMGLRQVCKVLGAKQNELTGFLLQRGLMYRTTPQGPLTPRAEHMHAGRFEAKTGTAEHGDTSHAYVHYKFSPKGVTWIAGLWGQHKAKLACMEVA